MVDFDISTLVEVDISIPSVLGLFSGAKSCIFDITTMLQLSIDI